MSEPLFHDDDGVLYCNAHGRYQCRECERIAELEAALATAVAERQAVQHARDSALEGWRLEIAAHGKAAAKMLNAVVERDEAVEHRQAAERVVDGLLRRVLNAYKGGERSSIESVMVDVERAVHAGLEPAGETAAATTGQAGDGAGEGGERGEAAGAGTATSGEEGAGRG